MTAFQYDVLRDANIARQIVWPGGEHVRVNFRGLELSGEVGELNNILKKLVRIELGISGTSETREALMHAIADEIGDVAVCLDLVGMELGVPFRMIAYPQGPMDPATYASDLCDIGTWLAGKAGEVCASLSAGYVSGIGIELGETLGTLDALARAVGIDLWGATVAKFNKTSRKHGLPVVIDGGRE